MIYSLVREIELLFPQSHGCAEFVLFLLCFMLVCLSMYHLTKWAEWFVSFVGAGLSAPPVSASFRAIMDVAVI